jgi:cytochrome c5
MQEPDQHESPIKNWKQLVIVVALAFVVPIALIVLLSQLVTGGPKGKNEGDSDVIARIKPVGQVAIAAPAGPKGALTGEQVYQQVCKTCHETGLAGAHKVGDKAAWAKVVAQGDKLTFEHAIKGIRAMPARGGNPDLEDVEVQRAVVFMANKVGAGWKEPVAPSCSSSCTLVPGKKENSNVGVPEIATMTPSASLYPYCEGPSRVKPSAKPGTSVPITSRPMRAKPSTAPVCV